MSATSSITYEKCQSPLTPLLLHIAVEAYLESYTYLWDDHGKKYLETFYSKKSLENELRDPLVSIYVILFNNAPAGFFKIRNQDLNTYPKDSCLEVDKLYLLKEYKGKQIGKKTLTYIERLAAAKQYKTVSLNVMDSSPAKIFYQRQGYTLVNSSILSYPHIKPEYNVILTLQKSIA